MFHVEQCSNEASAAAKGFLGCLGHLWAKQVVPCEREWLWSCDVVLGQASGEVKGAVFHVEHRGTRELPMWTIWRFSTFKLKYIPHGKTEIGIVTGRSCST